MAARYKAPAIKPDAKVVSRHDIVWTSGVGPLGPAHKVAVHTDGSKADRTVCGGWPGRDVGVAQPESLCPVCFRDSSPSEGTSK